MSVDGILILLIAFVSPPEVFNDLDAVYKFHHRLIHGFQGTNLS